MSVRVLIACVALVVVALGTGWWARGLFSAHHPDEGASTGVCPGGAAPLYWTALMDPTYIRDAPGKSPMGMDLVPECPGAGDTPEAGTVQVDSGTVQNIGVRTAKVETRDLSRTIRAVGRVAYDERRVSHVHTKVQGWVERLFVDYEGQAVKRGDRLLEIYSPELVATQEELLLAARYRDATGESPFEDIRGGGASLFEATRRRLALWDIPSRDVERLLRTGNVRKTVTLYAPTNGVVTKLAVRSGMEVGPNENLYTIADLSKVWVIADVYEFELPWVELEQEGMIELSYLQGETFSGKVTYVAPFLDPATRTADVRLELDNAAGHLKPEMFGDVVIHGTTRPDAVAIPSESVLRTGKRNIVVVSLGNGRFEPREVVLGLDTGEGWLEVREGLASGEDVVVSSQFLIDSESQLQEAVNKLLSAGRPGTADDPHTGHEMPAEHEAPEPDPHAGHDAHSSHEMEH